jgi:hypothetical protein
MQDFRNVVDVSETPKTLDNNVPEVGFIDRVGYAFENTALRKLYLQYRHSDMAGYTDRVLTDVYDQNFIELTKPVSNPFFGEVDPIFKVTDSDIVGYEDYKNTLMSSRNQQELEKHKREIDKRRTGMNVVSAQSWTDFAASFIASFPETTPLMLIPGAGIAKMSGSLLKKGGMLIASNAVISGMYAGAHFVSDEAVTGKDALAMAGLGTIIGTGTLGLFKGKPNTVLRGIVGGGVVAGGAATAYQGISSIIGDDDKEPWERFKSIAFWGLVGSGVGGVSGLVASRKMQFQQSFRNRITETLKKEPELIKRQQEYDVNAQKAIEIIKQGNLSEATINELESGFRKERELLQKEWSDLKAAKSVADSFEVQEVSERLKANPNNEELQKELKTKINEIAKRKANEIEGVDTERIELLATEGMEIPDEYVVTPNEESYIKTESSGGNVLEDQFKNREQIIATASDAVGIENIGVNPFMRAVTNIIPTVRQFATLISDSAIKFIGEDNFANPTSIESIVNRWATNDINTMMDIISRGYKKYTNMSWAKWAFTKIINYDSEFDNFKQEVGSAMLNGGEHVNEHVADTAKKLNKQRRDFTQKAIDLDLWGHNKQRIERINNSRQKINDRARLIEKDTLNRIEKSMDILDKDAEKLSISQEEESLQKQLVKSKKLSTKQQNNIKKLETELSNLFDKYETIDELGEDLFSKDRAQLEEQIADVDDLLQELNEFSDVVKLEGTRGIVRSEDFSKLGAIENQLNQSIDALEANEKLPLKQQLESLKISEVEQRKSIKSKKLSIKQQEKIGKIETRINELFDKEKLILNIYNKLFANDKINLTNKLELEKFGLIDITDDLKNIRLFDKEQKKINASDILERQKLQKEISRLSTKEQKKSGITKEERQSLNQATIDLMGITDILDEKSIDVKNDIQTLKNELSSVKSTIKQLNNEFRSLSSKEKTLLKELNPVASKSLSLLKDLDLLKDGFSPVKLKDQDLISLGKTINQRISTEKQLNKILSDNKKLEQKINKLINNKQTLEEKIKANTEAKQLFDELKSTRALSKDLNKKLKALSRQEKIVLQEINPLENRRETVMNKIGIFSDDLEEINSSIAVKTKTIRDSDLISLGKAIKKRMNLERELKSKNRKLESFTKKRDKQIARLETKLLELDDLESILRKKEWTPDNYFKQLPEGETFVNRIWDTEAIQARQADFEARIKEVILNQEKYTGTLEDATREARNVKNTIISTPIGRAPQEVFTINVTERGSLKPRTLNIPTSSVKDFVVIDPLSAGEKFYKTMNSDMAVYKTFGTLDSAEIISAIDKEFDSLDRLAEGDNIMKNFLFKQKEQGKRDIVAMLNRARYMNRLNAGNYTTATSIIESIVDTAKNITGARLMGKVLFTAWADLGQIVMTIGFKNFFGESLKLITDPKNYKNIKMTEDWYNACQFYSGSRQYSLEDTLITKGVTGTINRFSRHLNNTAHKFFLLNLWDDHLKFLSSYAGGTRILRHLEHIFERGGTLSAEDNRWLNAVGIGEKYRERIYNQFKTHGRLENGIYEPRIGSWTDADAQTVFGGSVDKIQRKAVITPGIADPIIFDQVWAKPFLFLRRFATTAWQKAMIPALQKRDANVFAGMSIMLGTQLLAEALKNSIEGREFDGEKMLQNAVKRMDVGSLIPDIHDITSQTFGFDADTRRYRSSLIETLAGPTFQTVENFSKIFQFNADGTISRNQLRAARKMLPLQNLFYLSWLFDYIEDGVADFFDLESQKPRLTFGGVYD